MKGVQILILHNSTYDTITLLAGFYCTLFTEQVPQWFQSLFEVTFQSLKSQDVFQAFHTLIEKQISCEIIKTKNVPSK